MKTYTTEEIVKASSRGLMPDIEWVHKESLKSVIVRCKIPKNLADGENYALELLEKELEL